MKSCVVVSSICPYKLEDSLLHVVGCNIPHSEMQFNEFKSVIACNTKRVIQKLTFAGIIYTSTCFNKAKSMVEIVST